MKFRIHRLKMTPQQLINRGNNLALTAVLTISGCAFLPEFFVEDELSHKLDDGLIFLIGLGAFFWYRSGNNRFTKSLVPIVLILTGLIIKILALVIEISDKADVGDDFGALILFILASIFALWLYYRGNKV
jgi:hypothetical protein